MIWQLIKLSLINREITLFVITLLLLYHPYAYSADPKIPSLIPNKEPSNLVAKSKMKLKHQNVNRHDGYKVIDSKGNEFYVDDIKKPKNKVVITEVNNNSKIGSSGKVKIESNVNIGKICFSMSCQ